MLKNGIIAVLLLLVAFLFFAKYFYKTSSLKQQKKGIDKEIIITPTSGEYSNRIVKFNKDNSIELGKSNFYYHKVNKSSELFSKRTGKWLVFDSTNNLKDINWYQNGKLYYHRNYIGDRIVTSSDSFYSDSFDVELLAKPNVLFETEAKDTSKVLIDVEIVYPIFHLQYSCNCVLRMGKESSFTNSRKVLATKRKDGAPLEFKIRYRNNSITYDRVDSYSLEY